MVLTFLVKPGRLINIWLFDVILCPGWCCLEVERKVLPPAGITCLGILFMKTSPDWSVSIANNVVLYRVRRLFLDYKQRHTFIDSIFPARQDPGISSCCCWRSRRRARRAATATGGDHVHRSMVRCGAVSRSPQVLVSAAAVLEPAYVVDGQRSCWCRGARLRSCGGQQQQPARGGALWVRAVGHRPSGGASAVAAAELRPAKRTRAGSCGCRVAVDRAQERRQQRLSGGAP